VGGAINATAVPFVREGAKINLFNSAVLACSPGRENETLNTKIKLMMIYHRETYFFLLTLIYLGVSSRFISPQNYLVLWI
jgi:hypothetical protein